MAPIKPSSLVSLAIGLAIREGSSLKALSNILLTVVLIVASAAHVHAAQNVAVDDHAHSLSSLDHSTENDSQTGHGSKHCGPLLLPSSVTDSLFDTTTTVWASASLELMVHLFVVDPPPPRKDSLAV